MPAYLGCGIGQKLIEACTNYSRKIGFKSIWLGSWKENDRANAFYTKMQFDIVGTTSFVLGSEIQEDFVFKKSLLSPSHKKPAVQNKDEFFCTTLQKR